MNNSLLEDLNKELINEIKDIQEEKPYHIDLKGYIAKEDGVYAQYPNTEYYLRLSREDKKTFTFIWCKEYKEGEFETIATRCSRQKPIIEVDNTRNNTLIKQLMKQDLETDRRSIEDFLDTIAVDIQNSEKLQLLKDKNFYVETTDQQKENEIEDVKSTTLLTFEDYPPHIQKLAREVLGEGELLERILNTVAYRLGSNKTEAKLINYAIMSLFGGGGVNTLANGKTGEGKSKTIEEVIKNYPDHYRYDMDTSPKYIYRDGENLQGKKIIYANDIELNETNIRLLKAFTREEDKIMYKTLEGDKSGKQKRLVLELTGDYVVLFTFAKNTPDEELANPFYNLNIAPIGEEKGEIQHKIVENKGTNALNHQGYKLANEINKCAIQYLVDKEYTVFNPYGLFINPSELNNRDINNLLDFVKGATLFKYDKRKKITIKGENYLISSIDDLNEIADIWEEGEEVQKYKLDSIQEEILKILPTLSEDDATEEANKYNDIEHNEEAEAFSRYNANAKRRAIDDDIKNNNTKALPIKHIMEKTGRGKNTVNRAMYQEDKYNNKPTLESLGLINYYETNIGRRYPQRMYYRKTKSSKSSKSIVPLFQNEFGTNDGGLKQKQSIIISLLYCSNILINKYIGDKIFSYCTSSTDDISSYDGMCNFLTGFISEYDNELQAFDVEHISLADLDYHNQILQKNYVMYNTTEYFGTMKENDNNAQNSNQDGIDCSKSELEQRNNTKTMKGAISEKSSKTKIDDNAQNSNQGGIDCSKNERNNKKRGKSGIESLLEKKKISDELASEVIHIIGTDELTINNIEQKLAYNRNIKELDDKTKLHLERLMDKLVKAEIVEETFTTGTMYSLSNQGKLALCIIKES